MTDVSDILALPYIQPAQAQKHIPHNEALRQLDLLVQLVVDSFAATSPPGLPDPGAIYAVGPGATAAWAGQQGVLAAWIGGAWSYVTPRIGWRAFGRDDASLRIWDGSSWQLAFHEFSDSDLQNVTGLGINTSSDTVNRLALASAASLFSHAGNGHQIKINKAAAADTASVLFQTGWSGRAEIGSLGGDDFSVKLSTNGSSWISALTLDASTGHMGLGLSNPASELEVADSAGTAGVNISGFRNGSDFGNAFVKFNTARADTADGAVGRGRGSIVSLGNPTSNEGILWLNANTASLSPETADDTALQGYQAGLRLGSNGTLGFWDSGTERVHINASGKFGIGTSPGVRLDVNDDSNAYTASLRAGHAALNSAVLGLTAARPASASFDFARLYSADTSDLETRLRGDGNNFCDGAWTGGGADYAEYFEWLDGNPDGQDRRGIAVVLEGDKIRPARFGDDPIGVISATPSVVGDGDMDRWKGKYLRDAFGAYRWQAHEVVTWSEPRPEPAAGPAETTDTAAEPARESIEHRYDVEQLPEGLTPPATAIRSRQQRRCLNPAYDPAAPYRRRADRPEWEMVGLMGKLRLRRGQPAGRRWIKMRDISDEISEWLLR